MSASGIGVYGNRGDEVLTEASPSLEAPADFLVEVGARMGGRGRCGRVPAGIRVVSTRFGMILSPAGGALGRICHPSASASVAHSAQGISG